MYSVCLETERGGGVKYQISGDEKCQNPFTGNLATLHQAQDCSKQTGSSDKFNISWCDEDGVEGVLEGL